jgi:hypothetical protein
MIREIFNRNAEKYISEYKPPKEHIKVIRSIKNCQSGAYGKHVLTCPDCGKYIVLNNSCRNRHCPVCQHKSREKWLAKRKKELLSVPYFHLVFTLPHVLNSLAYAHKKIVFDVLFRSVIKTIDTFSKDPKWLGAQTGGVAILHTWGQNLSFHPHLHVIIPAGGIIKDTEEWLPTHPKFFAPVKALSLVFKQTFIEMLIKAFKKESVSLNPGLITPAQAKKWVVFAQKPFKKPEHIINYLGNYTHRVAISNYRIIKVENGKVSFWYKEYRSLSERKVMCLSEIEFIRRFLQHVLPDNFYKIRHFGFMSNRFRQENIELAKQSIAANYGKEDADNRFSRELEEFLDKLISNPYPCPCCGGKMICSQFEQQAPFELQVPDT